MDKNFKDRSIEIIQFECLSPLGCYNNTQTK